MKLTETLHSPSLRAQRSNLMKDSSMGLVICCLAISVILTGCAKREKWETYKDPRYPIKIKYTKESSTFVTNSYEDSGQIYAIEAVTNYSQVGDEGDESYTSLYNVYIYQTGKRFSQYRREEYATKKILETTVHNMPVLEIKGDDDWVSEYILLIPNVYIAIYIGTNKVEALERMKTFDWTQKINTNSEEFKAWKAHILGILNNPLKTK